jgi:hypothetical protein
VYLTAKGKARNSDRTGLQLHVYGEELTKDSEAILTIPTTTGTIVLGRGSKIWHGRPPLQDGEFVAALTGCYGYAAFSDDGLCDPRQKTAALSLSGTIPHAGVS